MVGLRRMVTFSVVVVMMGLLLSCGIDDNDGPIFPSGGVLPSSADAAVGGVLYDKWWAVNGAPTPTTDHPLYPPVGQQSGDATWRCKECHGWDYEGVNGAYGSGSHFTGIMGVRAASADDPQDLFDLLMTDAIAGHNFSSGLSDDDAWDLAAFLIEGTLDMDLYIDSGTKTALGDFANGGTLYSGAGQCEDCHGADGRLIDFGGGEGLPELSNSNPWETLHKIRWGHPDSPMPSAVEEGLSTQEQVDILTYCQSLP